MQLDLCIRSLLVFGSGVSLDKITVIYNVDTKEHRESYDKLKAEYSHINFTEAFNFQRAVFDSCNKSEHVFFIVDDCIFTDYFNIQDITELLSDNRNVLGFSLRLGKNTTYCYPIDKYQTTPTFTNEKHASLKFDWTHGEYDFAYPLEVSSSIYRTADILVFLENCEYNNPNQLEGFLSYYAITFMNTANYLMCYSTSRAFCSPVNKVNKFNGNRSGQYDKYSLENLRKMFMRGMRINPLRFKEYISNSAHQEVELEFVQEGE